MSEITNVAGVNFASELTLNKVMNGQLASSNGNVVTAGLRAKASSLYNESIEASVASARVSTAVSDVTELQNLLTEANAYVTNFYKAVANSDYEIVSTTITEANTWLTNFLSNTFGDDIALYSEDASAETSMTIDMGLGTEMTVGDLDFTNLLALQTSMQNVTDAIALDDVVSNATGTPSTYYIDLAFGTFQDNLSDLITSASNELTGLMGSTSLQINALQNRSIMLEDVASTYTTAANEQILTGVGTSTSLLDSLTGSSSYATSVTDETTV